MILDVIVILTFIVFLIIGLRLGAIRMFSGFLLSFIAFFIASALGDTLSTLLYDNYLHSSIITAVSSQVSSVTGGIDVSSTVESLPLVAQLALKLSDVDITTSLDSTLSSAPLMLANAVSDALKPTVIALLSFVLTILLYIIIFFLLRTIGIRLLKRVFSLPILKQLNSLLGAICGGLCALLAVTIFAFLLSIITPYVDSMPVVFSESTIYNSYIFYYFYSGNIFSAII